MAVSYPLVPERTALLLIDLSIDFVAPGAPYECRAAREMIPDLKALASACRARNIPVIYTTHAHRNDGADLGCVAGLHPLTGSGRALREGSQGTEIYPEIAPETGDYVILKRRYSAFYGTDLELLLRGRGIDTVIVGGVSTNVCCDSTTRDAFYRDLKVIFLSDGTATSGVPDAGYGPMPAEVVHTCTLSIVAFAFGEVASSREVLSRLEAV